MGGDLIRLREQVNARADLALDAAWPGRTGRDYVREMQWAAGQLKSIAAEMRAKDFDRVEQSRTFRQLGSVYADLEPALGKDMLLKAKEAYEAAETLLVGQSDELERAKLNFNFGNTLRQIDPNDIKQLQGAERRFLSARAHFAMHAPQYLAQVDEALRLVEGLLRIAPLANAVRRNTDDMAARQEELAAGGNVSEIAQNAQEVMRRGGGAAGMVGQVQAIIDTLSDDQKQSAKYADVEKQMRGLTGQVLGSNEMTPEVKQIFSLLNDRLKSDAGSGAVSEARAESMLGALEEFGRIVSGGEEDVHALLDKLQKQRAYIEGKFEMAHYLSHGIKRPPEGSRAADLVELNWQIRRYLLEEMNRPDKGEDESKEALDLSVRSSRVDRRIYEAGADGIRAMTIEKEELRTLALAVRNFSARMQPMLARPIWRVANAPVDTNAVFSSCPANERSSLAAACRRSGLEIMAEPRGESYASARWKQIQKAIVTVFDFRVEAGPDMASVAYELGIALTLGKPAVVLVSKNQTMPFDVDVTPVVLAGGTEDDVALVCVIDQAVIWTCPRPRSDSSPKTLEYVLSRYPRPQQNVYVDQTLRMLTELRKAPDPLAVTRTLAKLFDFLNDGETMLVHPWWPPAYPDGNDPRLFHVMPFRPKWADRVTAVTREACNAAGVKYVRGDEAAEPNVIRSIWDEIARATHVLVDLTGFNPNVALELGIAHTLGKKVLMMGQGEPVAHIFPSISKLRVQSYSVKTLQKTLGKEVGKFLLSD